MHISGESVGCDFVYLVAPPFGDLGCVFGDLLDNSFVLCYCGGLKRLAPNESLTKRSHFTGERVISTRSCSSQTQLWPLTFYCSLYSMWRFILACSFRSFGCQRMLL